MRDWFSLKFEFSLLSYSYFYGAKFKCTTFRVSNVLDKSLNCFKETFKKTMIVLRYDFKWLTSIEQK